MQMEQNRVIGRVLSVDNFRVFIKIDESLNGAYKSGVSDIYEVARINSYLIIPVGADRIVALITRVTMKEEAELDRNLTTISLPTSARYISATMLGTIVSKGDTDSFIQGVYSFPSLDNPVWYVTEKDLQQIFDDKSANNISYDKDYYLPIGISPAFPDYSVKICPDQFFVKHAAILGNTGSGKSCTLTSILRNIFKYKYSENYLMNAHFVIFDTNGEYKDAFISESENDELNLINAYYYGGEEKVKVPYWLMNWNDFKALFRPGDGVQAPILNRAIGLAKNDNESSQKHIMPFYLKTDIEWILSSTVEELKKRTWDPNNKWGWKPNNEIILLGQVIKEYDNDLGEKIIELANNDCFNNVVKQKPIREQLVKVYNSYCNKELEYQVISEKNIDLPTYFNYKELCTKFIDCAIAQESQSTAKLNEYIATLRLRMNSFLNDKRIAIPLMLKDSQVNTSEILPQFISFLLGDFNRYYRGKSSSFISEYNKTAFPKDGNRTNQIMIIDTSQLPFEVLETVTALIGRIILEFVANFEPDKRGVHPIVIVLEEAQNYIAEAKDSIAKTVFERIAREGRKYGISLVVSSQRPSELSKTVLSQCNSFIIHRLQNPDDQKYIRGLVSSASADILEQLPVIPQQHAIITGDCVRTPVLVRIDDVHPTPNSHNPKFIESWLKQDSIPYKETCNKWLGATETFNQSTINKQTE
ncbi:MAG: DUF87 domain-containing protein [Paludibacteraceae bacterium]|nr:DUF87 domain-containing protein [Paludibacteraceae bacterium]MBQ6764516.1 DUF87 domain-containing protein [Paludibacteraceae bacterium]